MTAVHTQRLAYTDNDQSFSGYLSQKITAGEGPRAGVLVVHEAWGITPQTMRCADHLASLGYVALAADMYGAGKVAKSVDEAMGWMQPLLDDLPEIGRRFTAAKLALQALPEVDASRIGATGYCFGGSVVHYMARTGDDLKAVVSFHGGLAASTPAIPGPVTAKLLICTGAEDPFVPAEEVAAFEQAITTVGADFEVITYPGAVHSFTNPDATAIGEKYDMPMAYSEAAARDSEQRMAALFAATLGNS